MFYRTAWATNNRNGVAFPLLEKTSEVEAELKEKDIL